MTMNPRMPSSKRSNNVCRYFATSGSCFYGDGCAFQHVLDPSMAAAMGPAAGGGGGGGGVAPPPAPPGALPLAPLRSQSAGGAVSGMKKASGNRAGQTDVFQQ